MSILDSTIPPESLLRPYLNTTLALASRPYATSPVQPLFTAYYIQHFPSPVTATPGSSFLIPPPPSHILSESLDTAVTNAEAVFWHAVDILKSSSTESDLQAGQSAETAASNIGNIDSFWPPLSADPDEDDW
jgi:Rab proteins geranylgeranyltransferase component A